MKTQKQNPDSAAEKNINRERPEAKTDPKFSGPTPDNAKVLMQWATLVYRQTEKSKGWYLVMGLIVLVFVIYGLFFAGEYGWIVSITFLIMAAVYYFSEMKTAPAVLVSISDHGVRFGSKYFSYNVIKSFWIVSDEHVKILHLTLYKGTNRDISIMIDEAINVAQLRNYLLLQIPEEEGRKESFSDQLIRNLGL